jgi:hypothetical protein
MERPLTRRVGIGNCICLVNRVYSSAFTLVAILFAGGCASVRLDPDLCRNCRGDACRLACGVCAGEGQPVRARIFGNLCVVPWFGAEMGERARAACGKTVGWIGKGGDALGDASSMVQLLRWEGFLEEASVRGLQTLPRLGNGRISLRLCRVRRHRGTNEGKTSRKKLGGSSLTG